MLALLSLGWRKTARAAPRLQRGLRPPRPGIPVSEVAVPTYRRTALWKRVWALATTSSLAVLTGTLIAIVIAVGVSWGVTTLSGMLKR